MYTGACKQVFYTLNWISFHLNCRRCHLIGHHFVAVIAFDAVSKCGRGVATCCKWEAPIYSIKAIGRLVSSEPPIKNHPDPIDHRHRFAHIISFPPVVAVVLRISLARLGFFPFLVFRGLFLAVLCLGFASLPGSPKPKNLTSTDAGPKTPNPSKSPHHIPQTKNLDPNRSKNLQFCKKSALYSQIPASL